MANRQVPVSDFFKNDVPSYGAYDNTRKLCSYVDGLKISMRKILYTLLKKYGKEKVKTEAVANTCAAFTNYLHGAANLGGVCDTMAQSFVGANNYPLVDGNSGGFGTRINPTCAANRYTKIAASDVIRAVLNEDDMEIIGRQFFEGDWIEPKFFVPTFPVLFLNGSHGMSTGFSHDIYPRNPEEVMEYIRKKLSGTANPKADLLPWFRGHTGKVAWNEETQRNESFGVYTKNNMNSYTVTELPIGMEYQKYVELLDKLEENGTIQDYDDKCDPKTDKILFEIKTTREFTRKHETERSVYEAFKLVKSLPETLCCVDENNRVREFSSVKEILDAFIEVRLKYYGLRREHILKKLKAEVEKSLSMYLFVKGVVDKTIAVSNRKKADVEAQLDKVDRIIRLDGSYDYLLNMPIHSLTAEKLDDLKSKIKELKDRFDAVKATTAETMWLGDLKELKKKL